MAQQSRYPSFHVLNEADSWDEHTQTIVNTRLSSPLEYDFLQAKEAEMLFVICGILVDDPSAVVLPYVVYHFDQTLNNSPGEGQRKVGVPKESDLVRLGLEALEKSAQNHYMKAFSALDAALQNQLLQEISGGQALPSSDWSGVPQQPFFQKLLSLTIDAYCSHPAVWSEIGYAGPAYPRGYVRAGLGQLDPWEAKTER